MNMSSRFSRNGFVLAAALLMGSAAEGLAQTDTKPAPAEKSFTFEMRAKPWGTVFEWLTDKSGKPFISTNHPSGTFNFIGQQNKKYTLPQVIDIINDGLLTHKYILLNRGTSYTLVPADEKIDPVLVPRINVSQLPEHGDTEIVSLVYQCKSLVAEDSAPEVKKQMGPFGEVVILHKANQIIMQDTVANIRRIKKELDDQEEKEASGGQAETYTHRCIYIRARDAEATLRGFLGEQNQVIETTRPGSAPTSPMSPGGGPGGQSGQQNNRDDRGGRSATIQRVRKYTVTSDERTNTVFVNGPPDKIAQAKQVMARLDVGTAPISIGGPVLVTYPVKEGNAEALSKTLNEIHKGSAGIKIAAISNNQLMVLANPEDQMVIANQINGVRPPGTKTELILLTLLDSARTVETLKGLFPDSKNGAPYLEADPSRNAVIVKGTAEQVTDVKLAIGAIGENPAAQGGNMRIISLDKGSAATLADALQRMLQQMRPNPVQVLVPGASADPKLETPKPETPKSEAPKPEAPRKDPAPKNQNDDSCSEQSQLVDPAQQKKPAAKDKNNAPPITITAFGNKLIVTSEDPAALALVSELVRLLTQTRAGPGDFEVVRLKFANAVDVAKILDEAFNGPKPAAGNQGGGRGGFPFPIGGMFGGGVPQAGATAPREDRIRVVADPSTNALLIQASPLDMLTIRNLLNKQLDAGVTDSNAVIKTFVIGPLKYAHAIDVASVLRDVYRESMNNNLRGLGQISSPFTGSTRAPTPNLDANGNPKGVTLSLGIDDKTNSLIVACPTPMYEDIKKLVEQMEFAAADTKQTVKIVQVKGVDPALIQQALDVLQGRSSTNRSSSTRSDIGGSSGFSPFSGSSGGSGFRSNFGGAGLIPGPVPGGIGFPPGGGFTPSFTPGGGGFRGTGGGGGTRGSGGGSASRPGGSQSRGPDFFEYRVKDDPQPILFDPRLEYAAAVLARDAEPFVISTVAVQSDTYQPIQLIAAGGQPAPVSKGPDLLAPRLPVNAEALEQLGIVVIRSNNPADMEAALKIIDYIVKEGSKAEVEINLIPLKNADATSVVNTLNQLYARVLVGAYSNTQITAPVRPTGQQGGQQGGFPFPFGQQGGFGQPSQQPQQAQAAVAGSLVFIPVVRQNAILLAAPKSRLEDIKKEIARLDIPLADDGRAVPFPLKRAAAARVAQLITNFYTDRFPNETHAQHQIRVTYDDGTNTVFVQAAPADLAEIRSLIEHIDTTFTNAVNDLRIVPLRSAVADDLAQIITRTVTESYTQTSGTTPTTTGGGGALGGGALGQGVQGGALGQPGGAFGGIGTSSVLTNQPALARQTKVKALRLISNKNPKALESGIFEDVRITSDARTNSLIIDAPPQTMQLILALIKEMDIPPFARAEINVFTLQKADAVQTALTLQQLFLGQGGLTSTGTTSAGTGGARPAVGGLTTGIGGASLGSPRPLQFTISGTTPEGAPIIDLRLTVDERTNSLVVAGSRNDLDVIEAIIAKLETTDPRARRSEAYKLRNALAADVAAALNDFLPKSLKVITNSGQLSGFQELQKDVVITAEPISNTLLINASPEYFETVLRLVMELDVMPPQVMIQVLVAEVDITNSDEFGVQIGLQSPVIFNRGLTTGSGFSDNVTLNQAITQTVTPGFNFNNVNIQPGNNSAVNPSTVGYQGLNNLGVGLVSPINGVGGFVFSAASNSFNLLIRALAVQNRVDILSRPQIMTLDNQTALINVGKEIPIVTSTTLSATGLSQQNIDRRQVGVILQVTPKIGPDGQILMRIIPEVSAVDPTPVNLGNGNIGTALDIQHVETTVTAYDGETIALGGLLTRSETKTENKIPWLGDLPGVGALFRYRTQNKAKKELLFIMTPHVVRCRADADRILAEESRKMDWFLADVIKIHGNAGIDPLAPGAGMKLDPVAPLLPRTTGQKFDAVPAPQPVPAAPHNVTPGPMSQAAPPQQALPGQASGVYPASAPAPSPALLPTSLPAVPIGTAGQNGVLAPSPNVPFTNAQLPAPSQPSGLQPTSGQPAGGPPLGQQSMVQQPGGQPVYVPVTSVQQVNVPAPVGTR